MALGRVLASEVTTLKVPVLGGLIAGAPRSYMLSAGVELLDLSGKGLEVADIQLVVAAMLSTQLMYEGSCSST